MCNKENKKKVLILEVFSDLTARLRLTLDTKLSRRKMLVAASFIAAAIIVVVVNYWPEVLELANSIIALLT